MLIILRIATGGHASCIERISPRALASEVASTSRPVEKSLRFLAQREILQWDPDREIVWLIEGLDEQGFTGSKNDSSTRKHLESLPLCKVTRAFGIRYPHTVSDTVFHPGNAQVAGPDPSPSPSPSPAPNKPASPGMLSEGDAQEIREAISAARRHHGIESGKPDALTKPVRKQLERPLRAGYTVADWLTVVATAKRMQDRETARLYLTLATLSRLDNFVRNMEWSADINDLDDYNPPAEWVEPEPEKPD